MSPRLLRLLTTGSVVVLVTACGVPLQDSAQPLPPGTMPSPVETTSPSPEPSDTTSPSPQPTPSRTPTATPSPSPGFVAVDLFFVRDDSLVPLVAELPEGSGPQQVIDGLVAGAPPETGLRTVVVDPLTGSALVSNYQPEPGQLLPVADATIAVAPAFSSLPSAEQVLLLGQVVLSLSSGGWRTVSVVDEAGSPLAIPLPDGRLLDRPATALDFVTLRA